MHKSALTKYYYPHFTNKISEGSERLSNIPKAAQLLSSPAEILNLSPPLSLPHALVHQHSTVSAAPEPFLQGPTTVGSWGAPTAQRPPSHSSSADYSFQILYYFPPPTLKAADEV